MSRRQPGVSSGSSSPSSRPSLRARLWQSVVLRGPLVPETDRDRAFVTLHTLILHLRPIRVPARAVPFTHTFGLGGASLVLIGLLAATGILMMLGYQPVPGGAYASVVAMERDVLFGSFVRAAHHWSAQFLVIVALLHMARVFFTGGYHGPRQFNWVVGVGLLGLVLVNAFTGYLLPWDQLSYWAITISTGMLQYVPAVGDGLVRLARGGTDIGASTLVLFYTIHTSIVPATLVAALAFHFWRVRKAGGVVVPMASPPTGAGDSDEPHASTVMFLPHLLVREVSAALVLTALVSVCAALWAAPLGEAANPGMSPNPAKAPWYFMGLQELLIHLHPVLAIVILPLGAILAAALMPYYTDDAEPAGRWWLSARAARATAWTAGASAIAVLAAILVDDVTGRATRGGAGWVRGGFLPMTLAGLAAFGAIRWLHGRSGLTRNETVQALAAGCGAALVVLTLVGVWFRGPGMSLVWPWMW